LASVLPQFGTVLSYIALALGIFFFIFACKYYVSILIVLFGGMPAGDGNKQNADRNGNQELANAASLNEVPSENAEEPFISVQLPFYNEKKVARRILEACSNLDYSNYEVVVVDDSRDETVKILREMNKRGRHPSLKFVHRKDREGFKGGALAEALKHVDPRTKYVVVFDADFIPPSDILRKFLWYFNRQNIRNMGNQNHSRVSKLLSGFKNPHNKKENEESEKNIESRYEAHQIAAVQGYQLHSLNKSENWITRGIRAEFSGSYMVERVAEEFLGVMKMISGSVFMVRADVLQKLGWTKSITEDWDLTIRLYLAGYKVHYVPLIQAAAEMPTTVLRLVRQRMRWAEGHTFAVKKYFWQVLRSSKLTLQEKLEFLYFAPYYLQSLFFLIGSLCWLAAELLGHYLPFWNATLGWCLLLSNFLSLPLMGLTGLFLENSTLEDGKGVLSFVALSHIVAPFQAYAAFKGLLEKEEGTWIRTLKTGTITDKILSVQLRKVFKWASPKIQGFEGRERRRQGLQSPTMVLIFLLLPALIAATSIAAFSTPVLLAEAKAEKLRLWYSEAPTKICNITTSSLLIMQEIPLGNEVKRDVWEVSNEGCERVWNFYLYKTFEKPYTLNGRVVYTLYLYANKTCEVDIGVGIYDVDEHGNSRCIDADCLSRIGLKDHSSEEPVTLVTKAFKPYTFEAGHTLKAGLWIKGFEKKPTIYCLEYAYWARDSRIEFPGIVLPEGLLPILPLAPFIPALIQRVNNRRGR